ncbi:hypothetical protein TBR22_A07770 [Luteitalea sp. TBR-22]|uniref:hypothetical protein n=1 Tax=Luteitalea sp. TBR-22 TaxID=2802971 RepID=UPI001AFAA757|nr:hypothetical protein [Luteitalea sp. TBR-22]BCS31575.1 hypothetical protein TBR22_A07770 [Luteitalea sp. TBR-22]
MFGGASAGDLMQHATVSLVALGALGVVLRRVLGVFEPRPPAGQAGAAGGPHAAGPACSHCAANKPPQRP